MASLPYREGGLFRIVLKKEAEALGLILSEQAAANAAEFNDSLTRVSGSIRGLKNYFAEQMMPTLTALANRFTDFVIENRAEIIEFGEKTIKVLGDIAFFGAKGVAYLIDAFRGLQMIWEVLKIGFNEGNQWRKTRRG